MSRRSRAPRFCQGFAPRSRDKQLQAIGLSPDAGRLLDGEAYRVQPKNPHALCRCFDPSGGEWEDIEPPEPHEWLAAQLDKTPDQSFRDFVASRPNRPDRAQRTVYLQPLCEPGELDGRPFPAGPWPSWQALEAAVQVFYAPLAVRTLPSTPMASLKPRPASRKNDGVLQWHANQILDAVLARGLPPDAYCVLAVTMADLYPRDEWNFVYGLARLMQRVGVFSFCRHVPDEGPAPWREAHLLHRSMKTMLHEIGHMFGMKHCTWFNCLMRGSNGEGVEHQKNHLHLCPVCLRKLHWSIGFDVPSRYAALLEVYSRYQGANESFAQDCAFLRQRLAALQDLPPGATTLSASRETRPPPANRTASSPAAGRPAPVPRRNTTAVPNATVNRPSSRASSTSNLGPLRRASALVLSK